MLEVMIKIKQFNLFIALMLPLLAMSIVFAGSSSNYASAVEPGCYASSASVGSNNAVTRNTTSTDCPDSTTLDQVVKNNKCFVTTVGSSGQTAFNETNCGDIVTGNSNIGEATRPGPSEDTDGGAIKVSLNGEATLDSENYCGKGEENRVRISFDIGCLGNSYSGASGELNPVLDMLFALLRFVSAGVGLVVIGSIIWAGIQYSTSRGNPQSTEAAIKRVTNAVIALLIYIFSFAILNFLVPGGLFVG